MRQQLYLGCTAERHRRIGIDAIVNARGGLQALNDRDIEEIELYRDGEAIKKNISLGIRWYGPASKFFRRNKNRIQHLIASQDD